MKKFLTILFAMLLLCGMSNGVLAILVDLPDTAEFGYFLDTESGLIWMDIDSYFNKNYFEVESVLVGTGFHIAKLEETQQLQNSSNMQTWEELKLIIGDSASRELIWGFFDDGNGNNLESWMEWWHDFGHTDWHVWIDCDLKEYKWPDLGAWVVSDAPGPEPSTWLLLLFGLSGMVGIKKKFN